MPATRTLLLDVMGTICYDPFYVEVPAFFGMTLDELLQSKHPTAWVDFERGYIGEAEFLPKFFRDGRSYDHAGLMRCFQQTFRFLPGMEELLRDLLVAGHSLHLFSNYTVWYRWIEAALQLERFARWTAVSCELGLRKPDPEAYRKAAERAGASPAECLFVDDRESNCAAARDVGMEAIRFKSAGQLRREMRALGRMP